MPTLIEVLMGSVPLRLGCREGAAMHDFWNWLSASPLANLRIIDGAAVAVDLEAGVDKFKQQWLGYSDGQCTAEEALTAILTACGIIVPDEVVEVGALQAVYITPTAVETVSRTIKCNPGDIFMIKRKEGEE